MKEFLIKSVPVGADVRIGGVSIGTTPITGKIDDGSLEAFRAECMTDDKVSCTWDVLRKNLEGHAVCRLWWDLTRNERYSITVNAIRNNDYTETALKVLTGAPNCRGATSGTWAGSCALAAAIRYTKFAPPCAITDHNGPAPSGNQDGCYFQLGSSLPIRCLRQSNPYNLPCYFVQVLNEPMDRRHILCAIQIENSFNRLDNFVVFQYNDVDVKPGDNQMGLNAKVVLYSPLMIGCFGIDSRTDEAVVVASFDI